jgi:transcriptional regulator with XRE-family HTH domain
MLAAEFGRRLRRFREDAGLSQEQLAHLAGVHRTYVGHVERGETTPTLYSIVRLANALSIKAGELVDDLTPGETRPRRGNANR